jgi:hypothetical protein
MTRKNEHSAIVMIQISILIISIIAFSSIISAQTTSSPLPTNVLTKKIIIYSQNKSSVSENSGAKITGRDVGYQPGTINPGLSDLLNKAGDALKLGPVNWDSVGNFLANNGVMYVAYVWAATFLIAGFIGLFSGQSVNNALYWANTAGLSAGAGLLVGNIVGGLFASTPVGWVVGIVVLIAAFFTLGMRSDQRAVIFNSIIWSPKLGGSDCSQCNGKEFPCTMYQCKSLGVGCVLKNEGDNARCVDGSAGDNSAPLINARKDSLPAGYSYVAIPGVANGVEIKYTPEGGTAGDLPAYQRFTFGIELNDASGKDKVGTCKIADHRTANWAAMGNLPFGNGLWQENHTQLMAFPGMANLKQEEIALPNGGAYEYYVRCENVNGFANDAEFLFKFQIDPFPDHTQPVIYGFNFLNPTSIKYLASDEPHEARVVVYTNEPSTCKWDIKDTDYAKMQNNMTDCSNSATNFNAQLSYSCSGKLTGLQNGQDNKFYFRCSDTSGNADTASKTLTLAGTRSLVIDSASPDGKTIKGASDIVQVTLGATTSAGAANGVSTCYYSTTGNYDDYTQFEHTKATTHTTVLPLLPGENKVYYIQCTDKASNSDTKTIQFNVESDSAAPIVLRAYYQTPSINIITDELANCVYGTDDNLGCNYNFADGIKMTTADNLNHEAQWDNKNTFYIRCKDNYGNEPSPSSCSITIKPFSL